MLVDITAAPSTPRVRLTAVAPAAGWGGHARLPSRAGKASEVLWSPSRDGAGNAMMYCRLNSHIQNRKRTLQSVYFKGKSSIRVITAMDEHVIDI